VGESGPLEAELDRGLYELLGYLLTSARGLLEEPGEYGPLRLAEAASRLCAMLAGSGSSYGAAARQLQAGIDAGKFSVLSDPPAFQRTLDQAVRDYTRRLA
jgi:hypothetical protein